MIAYSIPYILLVLFYGIMAALYSVTEEDCVKRKYNIYCIIIFVLFLGFRGFIGDDWTIYYKAFQKITIDSLSFNLFQLGDEFTYEPGFTFLMLICKCICPNYTMLNLVCCVINVLLLYIFLKRYVSNVPLGFMIYMCMGGFVMSINLLRNTIAILIMANSLHFIIEKKPVQYFSMCLFSLMFHFSSLIYFPLYFILNKSINKWIYLMFYILGIFFFFSEIKVVSYIIAFLAGAFSERMQLLAQNYTELLDSSRGISIGFIERSMTGLLIFCYYKKLHSMHKEVPLFINSFVCYFFFYFFFCEFDVMSGRLANLFTYSYWVLWPLLISAFHYENNKKLFICFLTGYSILKMIGICSSPTYNYDNVLLGADSYYERLYIHDKYTNND